MGLNPNIQENEFINKLNWTVLSCHDKVLSLASEALITNASLYFILYKFAGRDNLRADRCMGIGGDSYYKYIMEKSGLNFQRVYKSGSLKEELKAISDRKEVAAFFVNTKYQKGARLAGKKDHPHFMLYKGYDDDGYHFIDEDWSKEYWKTRDTDTDVCYVERVIPYKELEALAFGISSCNIFKSDEEKKQMENKKYFIYYKVTDSKNNPCILENLQKSFENNMQEYLNNKNEHYSFILSQMEIFKEKLASRRAETIEEVNSRLSPAEQRADKKVMREQEVAARKDELFAVRSRFIYPYESELIGAHSDFLYSIMRVVQLRSNQFSSKEEWLSNVNLLLKRYGIIKMQISRGVILVDNTLIDRAIELFSGAFEEECKLYQGLLDSGWKLEEYNK